MDRRNFEMLIATNFLDIIIDEYKFFLNNHKDYNMEISIPILSAFNLKKYNLDNIMDIPINERMKIIHSETGFIYYYYDLNKVRCKKLFKMENITLDRHKITTFFMLSILDYWPVKVNVNTDLNDEIILMNYRIAFRFALSYAAKSLYHSFYFKIEQFQGLIKEKEEKYLKEKEEKYLKEIEEYSNKIVEYKNAIEKIKKYNCLLLPVTRGRLDTYIDHYIKALYLQLSLLEKKESYPYMLLADTFYWIDVYTKMQLGITVEPEHNGDMYGLRRYSKTEKTN